MTKFMVFALMVFMLVSCNRDLHLKDVVVTDRLYSPDSAYVALIYYIDNGAMGESRSMASVLKVGDTPGLLNKGRLPCKDDLPYNSCYFPDRWIDSKTLQVTLEEISFVKAGLPFDSTAIKVNGIDCTVVPYDDSYKRAPLIRHFSFSENRKNILVVYQYSGGLNISAIKYGDKLPKYGNLLTIPEGNVDPIKYAAWHGDDIDLYMKDAGMYKPSDYINRGVAYKVNFVDIGQSKASDGSVLYEDPRIDSLLKEEGVTATGVITKSIWQMWDNKSAFNYEYEYRVAGQRFRRGFRIFRDFKAGAQYKNGDSVEVVYDPKEPLIHTDKISH
jgi:hypothetical protein